MTAPVPQAAVDAARAVAKRHRLRGGMYDAECACGRWPAADLTGHAEHLAEAVAAAVVAAVQGPIKAEAWDEGHRLSRPHSDYCEPTCPNPYRADRIEAP